MWVKPAVVVGYFVILAFLGMLLPKGVANGTKRGGNHKPA